MPRTRVTRLSCLNRLNRLYRFTHFNSFARAALISGLLAGLGACAGTTPVQPWEKGFLSKPAMTFEGDRLDSNFVEHTYASKEAAAGGAGVGGGGCGCN